MFVSVCNMQYKVKLDFALFCAGSKVSQEWALKFINLGAPVIDNSNAFRRDPDVPLIVPEINYDSINKNKLISNPNCSTIQISLPLFVLNKINPIKRIVVSILRVLFTNI